MQPAVTVSFTEDLSLFAICRLVSRFTYGSQNYCQSDWSFYFSQACSELHFFLKMSSIFYRNKLMYPIRCKTSRFISELMDVFLMAGFHQEPDQSNYLAGGQT